MPVTRAELEASLAELRASVRDPAHGILGPESVAWRLGGDLVVFAGGGRAALLQLAHPMVAYAIDHHSRTRADVAGRFARTFHHVFAMVFGDVDDAFTAARRVHAIHAHITGTFPERVGPYAAGTPYHANDAHALRWVHATLVDTVLVVRERLGGPLPVADKDAFVREQNRFAALFAIPPALLPRDHAGHAAYMERMLTGDQLAIAPCAQEMAKFLFGGGAIGTLVEAITSTLLPRHLARGFALADAPVVANAAWGALGAVARVPVMIPARHDALRRIAGRPPSRLAAWTERRLFRLAKRTSGAQR